MAMILAATCEAQQQGSQPAPTDSGGKPTPPPVSVPGAPDLRWKWNPDKRNPRGGTWGPAGWKGANPPNASWGAVDRQTLRTQGIQHELADPKGLYNVTPDNQGHKLIQ